MAEEKEKTKVKSLKLKKESGDSGRTEVLKSAVKKPSTETPDRKEKGTPDRKDKEHSEKSDKVLSKSKDPLKSGTKELGRSSSIGKNLVKVGKEFAKSNGREQEGRVSVKDELKSPIKVPSKGGKVSVKAEMKSPIKVPSKGGKVSVKAEMKSPIKVPSKGGKVSIKEEVNANGKEQGKSAGKELGKVNGKDSGGVRDLIKAKDEDREKEKGKSSIAKSSPVKTPVKPGSATKASPKSTKAGASLSVVKKKIVQTTTATVTTTKTVTEQKKEKKVYSLPGQKHDPPEERDPLRIFYSTLREQKPESEMAEIWLMEYGLLSHDEAKKAFERKQKRGQSLKHGTASKSPTPSRLSNGSPGVKKSTPVSNGKGKVVGSSSKGKKKRDKSESDSDEDFLQKAVPKKKLKAESESDDDFLLKAVSKKKLKAESDSDDDFLQKAVPKKKLKA